MRRQGFAIFHLGNAKRADGLRDVLEFAFAEGLEGQGQLIANLVIDTARNTNSFGLRCSLQSSGDVHTVTQQVSVLYDHVADVDPDPKCHLPSRGQLFVARAQRGLNLSCTADSLDRTRKFRKDCITSGVKDTAAMN